MTQNACALFSRLSCPPAGRFLFSLPAFLCSLLFFLVLAHPAQGLPPTRLLVEKPVLLTQDNMLFLTLSVSVDDEEGLRELLKNGAVLELATNVTVERERSWWANAEVFTHSYSSVLRHEPLSRDFLVVFPDRDGERQLRDRNLTRLLYESWKKLSLPVLPPDSLIWENGESYQLYFTITLRHIEVPPWLEKSLVFWSAEVVPPEQGVLTVPPPGQ